jgi:hypothetical protein
VSTLAFLCSIIDRLSVEFKMKDLGPLSLFLGVNVRGGFFLNQGRYAE